MYKRSIGYMQSHDIDWFFRANGDYYHCASNGGILPVECRDIVTLNRIRKAVSIMTPTYSQDDIILNNEHIERIVRQQVEIWGTMSAELENPSEIINFEMIRLFYLSSFLEIAKRGFISIDRISKDNGNDDFMGKEYHEEYVFIAKPKELPTRIPLLFDRPYEIVFPDLSNKIIAGENTLRIQIN